MTKKQITFVISLCIAYGLTSGFMKGDLGTMSETKENNKMVEKMIHHYIDKEIVIDPLNSKNISHEDLSAFEQSIGFNLPKSYIRLAMSDYKALRVEADESIWERPSCGSFGSAWTFSYGFDVYGFGDDLPDDFDVKKNYQAFKKETGHSCVPFMKISTDPDLFCFASDQKIYQWDHETNELNYVDDKFEEFLTEQVQELMERKTKMKERNLSSKK